MKKILTVLLLIGLPTTHALAGPGCQATTGGSIVLEKVRQNATGPELFGCINRSFDILVSSGTPARSTGSWLIEGRIDVSTIGANGTVPAVYFSSGVHIGAASGLVDDYGLTAGSAAIAGGLTASSGTFTATGAAQFSVQTSSGIDVLGGTLRVEGSGGINTTFGSRASTYTATATGNTVYSLVTSTGINMQAGTLLAQGPIQGTATGNATPSLFLSSGAAIGSDVHVTGTLEATKLKGDGSQLTGVGGGGTVTTSGSPAVGQVPVFQAGTVLSSSPISVSYGAGGASTVTVNATACVGLPCRIGYSSGTAGAFTLVLQSSTTYQLHYDVRQTSGSTTAYVPYNCTINGDLTAADYKQSVGNYPTNYGISTGAQLLALSSCGGGATAANDRAAGVLEFSTVPGTPWLAWAGTFHNSCNNANIQANFAGGTFQASGPPWTINCYPVATTGWQYEAILYQIGK